MKCFVILFVLRLWTFSRKFQFIQQVLVYTRSSNNGINFFSVVFFTLYTYQKILSYDLLACRVLNNSFCRKFGTSNFRKFIFCHNSEIRIIDISVFTNYSNIEYLEIVKKMLFFFVLRKNADKQLISDELFPQFIKVSSNFFQVKSIN